MADDLRSQILSILAEGGQAPAQPAQPAAPAPPVQPSIREQVAAGFRDALQPPAQPPAQPQTLGQLVQARLAGQPMNTPRPVTDGGAPAQHERAGLESNDPCWNFDQGTVDRLVNRYGMTGAGKLLKQRLQRDMRNTKFWIGPDRGRRGNY